MHPIIHCENITKAYVSGDIETVVLKGITFGIEPGEFVAIMGLGFGQVDADAYSGRA